MAGRRQPDAGPLEERALELSWIADLEPEVVSDLRVFHRVDDPYALDSALFFTWAEQLPHYQGAVRGYALREAQSRADGMPMNTAAVAAGLTPAAAPPMAGQHIVTHDDALQFVPDGVRPQFTGEPAVVADDIAGLAAMSNVPGFPRIEYEGG